MEWGIGTLVKKDVKSKLTKNHNVPGSCWNSRHVKKFSLSIGLQMLAKHLAKEYLGGPITFMIELRDTIDKGILERPYGRGDLIL